MKKTKIEQRIENAFDAFFDNEDSSENQLSFVDYSALSKTNAASSFAGKAGNYFDIFKKIFLFLPGVLILHLACFSAVFFYKDFGVNFWMLFWFASGIFMVWAGLGELKNKKHLMLPLSVVSIGLAIATLFSFLPIKTFEYSFYLLPLFFAVPILVKNWIDAMENIPGSV